MISQEDLYFEIFDAGDLVRIEPKHLAHKGAEMDYDRNWIITTVTIKAGKFSGKYDAEFMTIDFEKFKQQLMLLYDDLKGSAVFEGLEGQLELSIIGDGLGHFTIDVAACDHPGYGGRLTFTMSFDQTDIKDLIHQLKNITETYPVTGNFNIKDD